jgi:hypothetical protein
VTDVASVAVGPIGQGDENTFDEATADEVTK